MVMNKTNLFYYAKPWEAFACVFFFSAIVIAILLDVPSSEDEGVVVIDDVITSYRCYSIGKSDVFDLFGASGRKYTLGARRGSCRTPKENHDYVGRSVTAYFRGSSSNEPFRLDFEGLDSYGGGVTYGRVVLAILISGCLILFPFLVVLGSRQRKFNSQK